MDSTRTGTRAEWVTARMALYEKEADLIRTRDSLSEQRRELPRVLIDKEYVFQGPDGKVSLPGLFEGRRQLIVYHFMVPQETGEFCTSCSFWIDNIGHPAHLNARDTTLVVDCPVPFERIDGFRRRMGWLHPCVSSYGTDFYADMFVKLEDGQTIQPGISAFIRDGDRVYHTYSTLITAGEMLNSTYHYLDLTALGRQEEGLSFKHDWVRYHDSYE